MIVTHLELTDFRNYSSAVFELTSGTTAVIGDNGQGKTNLAEALAYLATLSSFRGAPGDALIRVGSGQAIIRADVLHDDGRTSLIEAELLSDADNLDATGAVGIARVFAYAGEHDDTLYDPDRPPSEDESVAGETSFNHFHKKILELEDRMYTDAGRALAADRHAFVEAYLDRFEREAHGEDRPTAGD